MLSRGQGKSIEKRFSLLAKNKFQLHLGIRIGSIGVFLLLLLTVMGCSVGKEEAHSKDSAASNQMGKANTSFQESAAPAPPMMDSASASMELNGFSGAMPNSVSQATSGGSTPGLNLKMIYTANITMQVENYADAQSEIRDSVLLVNGYILQFNDNQSQYERGGTYVIKVPANGFMSFIDGLQQMKTVKPAQLSLQGQDVTEEYVDLTSRLKAKQLQEERMLSFMEKANGTDDLVRFSFELGRVQEEIEYIKGRMRYLDQHVAFSTIEIRLYEKLGAMTTQEEEEKTPVWDRAVKALQNSMVSLVSIFSQLIIILFAVLPFLITLTILTLVGWIVYRRSLKNKLIAQTFQQSNEDQRLQMGAKQMDQTMNDEPAREEEDKPK